MVRRHVSLIVHDPLDNEGNHTWFVRSSGWLRPRMSLLHYRHHFVKKLLLGKAVQCERQLFCAEYLRQAEYLIQVEQVHYSRNVNRVRPDIFDGYQCNFRFRYSRCSCLWLHSLRFGCGGLMRVAHDGRYAVAASRGGAPKHPVWYWNLLAHPHVELQDGAVKKDYRAHLAEGAEYAEWWARANETWPDYATYQAKTTRKIPVFVLEPMEN